jgi:hypothetical protein
MTGKTSAKTGLRISFESTGPARLSCRALHEEKQIFGAVYGLAAVILASQMGAATLTALGVYLLTVVSSVSS